MIEYQLYYRNENLQSSFECPIAIDTETTVVDIEKECPRFVLGTVSDGEHNIIFNASELPRVINNHAEDFFVCHNAAFDFWVIEEELRRQFDLDPVSRGSLRLALSNWWKIADENRLSDTMILDQLVRLAEGKAEVFEDEADDNGIAPRNLGRLGRSLRCKHQANKEDEYRKRYGELLGIEDWSKVDEGFFRYAITDAVVTWECYPKLVRRARKIEQPFIPSCTEKRYQVYPDAVERFGWLSEHVQVKAAIALLKTSRNGMLIDVQRAAVKQTAQKRKLEPYVEWAYENCPQVFPTGSKRKGAGVSWALHKQKLIPKMSVNEIREILKDVAVELVKKGVMKKVPLSQGVTPGLISASWKQWTPYKEHHPFLENWIGFQQESKALQFYEHLRLVDEKNRLHPRYNPIVSTGRVSCRKPNVMQMPKDGDFRSLFIASYGYKILTIDYAAIELRVLAAICKVMFGNSKLAEVFDRPYPYNDPHAYTAAMIQALDFEDFLSLKGKDEFKEKRQRSKAVNFGIPGGLGPVKLRAYAKVHYGVDFTEEESVELRRKVITEVYPEWEEYLADATVYDLAARIGRSVGWLIEEFLPGRGIPNNPSMTLRCMIKVAQGRTVSAKGKEYTDEFKETMWKVLEDLLDCAEEDVSLAKAMVKARLGCTKLIKEIFGAKAVTLTGRIKNKVLYTQARNLPFQGLTADGAKLGLWELVKQGYRLIAFVHDEALVEVPESTAKEDAKKIQSILEDEMEKVLNGIVPITTEHVLANCWSKG